MGWDNNKLYYYLLLYMSTTIIQDSYKRPLQLYDPTDLVTYYTMFSPIIIATCVAGMSVPLQNVNGLVYLAGLLLSVGARTLFYWKITPDAKPAINNGICTSVDAGGYGSSTFSAFVFAFTITYLGIPMFTTDSVNVYVFIGLIAYFVMDVSFRIFNAKCITDMTVLLLNTFAGALFGGLAVGATALFGITNLLFFNRVSSNREFCSQPKEQTFKCQVYKDGMLVGNI